MATYRLDDDKINFSYLNHSKGILFDEKKKRFVDFSDMDIETYKNYRRTFLTVNIFFLNFIISTGRICLEKELLNMTVLLIELLLIFWKECMLKGKVKSQEVLFYSEIEQDITISL